MTKEAEQQLADQLLVGMQFVWLAMIGVTARLKRKSIIAAPAVAAVMGYCCFVAAALLANAKFPAFMRDHLFDGLAPAAAVGFLVNLFPTESLDKALAWIRRPVLTVVLFFAGGALIFGAIAGAAVFISGSDDFTTPVWILALWGDSCSASHAQIPTPGGGPRSGQPAQPYQRPAAPKAQPRQLLRTPPKPARAPRSPRDDLHASSDVGSENLHQLVGLLGLCVAELRCT